jgi:hypothetical protein
VAPHARENLFRTVWLADEVVHTRRQHLVSLRRKNGSRQGRDPDLTTAVQVAYSLGRLSAGHPPHPHIHPDEMGLPRPEEYDTEGSIFCRPNLESRLS